MLHWKNKKMVTKKLKNAIYDCLEWIIWLITFMTVKHIVTIISWITLLIIIVYVFIIFFYFVSISTFHTPRSTKRLTPSWFSPYRFLYCWLIILYKLSFNTMECESLILWTSYFLNIKSNHNLLPQNISLHFFFFFFLKQRTQLNDEGVK